MQWVHDHPIDVAALQVSGAEEALDEELRERAAIDERETAREDAENPAMMPAQKPGKSEQRVGTPVAYLDWVARHFHVQLSWDLAANEMNTVVASPRFYGPGSPSGEDGLSERWDVCGPALWLNPPYADIAPWASRCAVFARPGVLLFLLVPASVGSTWWRDYVHGKARVHFGRRIRFVGHKQSYPKDLALCVYGEPPDYVCVDWPSG